MMSATDHLNQMQFFHGTTHGFEPGDVIDPSKPHTTNWGISDPTRAYITTDREDAQDWARQAARRRGGEPMVYGVQPTGVWQRDRVGGQATYSTRHPLKVTSTEHTTDEGADLDDAMSDYWTNRKRLVSTLGEPMR